MKIALLGYGRMGKEIEKIALSRKHDIVLRIDINNTHELNEENLQKADVAIDFSIPESAYDNILLCFSAGTPIVSGTTGWMDKFNEVVTICNKNKRTFFYASNYSVGVNIFFDVNRKLAQLMNKFKEYDVRLEEVHHVHKLDAPSGTAITLAEDIIDEIDRKNCWELDAVLQNETLPIKAVRKDEVPGIHTVTYDSSVDFIEIKHSAKNRIGFAMGAVLASEFIFNKVGVYTMKDLMNAE